MVIAINGREAFFFSFVLGFSGSPFQPVKSLPLKSAVKPGGGVLSGFSWACNAVLRPIAAMHQSKMYEWTNFMVGLQGGFEGRIATTDLNPSQIELHAATPFFGHHLARHLHAFLGDFQAGCDSASNQREK
jgi:hypothetical protein